MLFIYLIGIIIITLFVSALYLYNSKRHEEEINKIEMIEKKMSEAGSKSKACSINNLNDPRSCYLKSNYSCSWNEAAGRCDQI